MITNTFQLSLQPGATPLKVPLSQYDKGETLIFKLRHKATSASISSGVTAEISGTKSDGQGFTHSATYSYSNGTGTVTVTVADDMTDVSGLALCEITLKKGSGSSQQRLSTSNFYLDVEAEAMDMTNALFTIRYMNYNGTQLLYQETVKNGEDGTYTGRPSRPSDTSYIYTFIGWSAIPNSYSADPNIKKNVTGNKDIYAAYSRSPNPSISDSWSQIFAAEDDGTYISKYAIGQTKAFNITVGSSIKQYNAQIVAFDTDTISGGSKAKITWIIQELYQTPSRMYISSQLDIQWPDTDLRNGMQNILNAFQSEVKSRVLTVTKTYKSSDGYTRVINDKLWIPSMRELYGSSSDYEESGPIYEYFTEDRSRIARKTTYDTSTYFWTRTRRMNTTTSFYMLSTSGGVRASGSGNNLHGVCIGFCT